MKVAMLGMGRLGTPVSCAMVMKGHEVSGYDIVPELREELKQGKSNLYEPDLEQTLRWSLDNGLIICDTVYDAIKEAEIIFVAVPTPSLEDDSFDTSFVKAALTSIVSAMERGTNVEHQVVAIISTVLPGTTRNEFWPILVNSSLYEWQWGLCYNAQFIAMGTTIYDMLNPEFVLIGELDKKSGDVLGSFYSQLVDAPLLRMSIESAETVKMSYNTMIGFKIVYGNTIMEMCDKVPYADCDEVHSAISKATSRLLSPRYLKGGMGDGGGCLPAGEMVITEHGPRPIETIRAGDRVLTVDGTLQKVIGTWEREYSGDLIGIKVRGLPVVKVTGDHRMIVAEDGRPTYPSGKRDTRKKISEVLGETTEVLAKDLTKYHLVPFPKARFENYHTHISSRTKIGMANWGTKINTPEIERPEHIDNNYIELAGWYLSEGWAISSSRRGRLGFAFHEREIETAKRLGEICVKLDPPVGRRKNAKVSIKQTSDHGIEMRYGTKKVARWLIDDFGKGVKDKSIPCWLLYGALPDAKLLMKGLWQGDGHSNEREMYLSTISRDLAWGAHLILLRCGIPSTIKVVPERTGNDGQRHQQSYEVSVSNKQYLTEMAEITGLEDKSGEQEKLYDMYGYRDYSFWRPVTGLSCEPFKGKVYNLWVEKNNTYVTGCGAVHNCHPRDNRALSYLAQKLGLSTDPFAFVMNARTAQSQELAQIIKGIKERFGYPVAIMGLTFKPETNLILDSPSLMLIQHLLDIGVTPEYTYDPIINDVSIPFEKKIYVIATRHEEYLSWEFEYGSVIIDPWRMFADNPPPECIYRPIGK